eukprot:COSAG01_NODE_35752_length_527_cov_0.712617_1_plen_155_part_01
MEPRQPQRRSPRGDHDSRDVSVAEEGAAPDERHLALAKNHAPPRLRRGDDIRFVRVDVGRSGAGSAVSSGEVELQAGQLAAAREALVAALRQQQQQGAELRQLELELHEVTLSIESANEAITGLEVEKSELRGHLEDANATVAGHESMIASRECD